MIGPQWPSTPEEFEKLSYDLEWEILKVQQEQLEAKREFVFRWRELPVGTADPKHYQEKFDLKEETFKLRIELLEARKEIALLKRTKLWRQEYIRILEQDQIDL